MTSHPNRTRRIWTTGGGNVCLRVKDEFGEAIVRKFWVPLTGNDAAWGYVYEMDDKHPGPLGKQVCDRLEHLGNTLTADRDTLIDVIRREYRRALASDRRENAKWL